MKILTFSLGAMQTNCYILIDETTSECAVVDPGDECERILNAIASRGLTLKMILLTHGHFDHMMALGELREATGAPLCIHRADARALLEPSISYMKQFAGIERSEKPAERLLEEGDILTLGRSKILVLHTPGHTPGSVCYICDATNATGVSGEDSSAEGGSSDADKISLGDKFIVSGDTLFRGSIGRYDLAGGDYEQLCESLARLTALEGSCKIYPGHGSSTTLDNERMTNLYLQ